MNDENKVHIHPDIEIFAKLFKKNNLKEKYTYNVRWEPPAAREYNHTNIYYGDIHLYDQSRKHIEQYIVVKKHGIFDKSEGPLVIHSFEKKINLEESIVFESYDVNEIINFLKQSKLESSNSGGTMDVLEVIEFDDVN